MRGKDVPQSQVRDDSYCAFRELGHVEVVVHHQGDTREHRQTQVTHMR